VGNAGVVIVIVGTDVAAGVAVGPSVAAEGVGDDDALGTAVMMNGGVSAGVRAVAGPARGSVVLVGRAVAAVTGAVDAGAGSRGDADGAGGPL